MTEIKAGFLTKCGGKVKNWKKRWVILRSNGFLSYYEKKGGNEKGSIDVINSGRVGYASSIESSEVLPSGTDAAAAFSIVTKERTFTFCSECPAECKDWIACLTRVKSNDSDDGGVIYQGYPMPTNPSQPHGPVMTNPPSLEQKQPLPPEPQAPMLPPKDQPPAYPYPVGAYNGSNSMPQPQQPVGGPPMPQPQTGGPQPQAGGPPMQQPPPYQPSPAHQGYAGAPPPTQAYRQPAAPYPHNQAGYYRQPYQQPPYQQPYRQPYPAQPYRQPYQQPYQQQPYYPTKQPYYQPRQQCAYPYQQRPPARQQQQQSSSTTVVAGGMVISINNNQQQGRR